MGKLADAVAEEIDRLEEQYEEVCTELKVSESKCDDYEVQVAQLLKTIEEQDAYIRYAERCIEGLNTAYEVSQRLEGAHGD